MRKENDRPTGICMDNIQSIVTRCQDGDLDAFASLYRCYQQRVFGLACAILKNEEQAKDAMQDAFMAVFKNITTFQGESAFETWLTAIAVNTCRATLRRNRVRQALSLENLVPRLLFHISSQQDQLERTVEIRQQRESLWALVDELDDRLRLPLILRYRYDYSCSDIGQILGLATTTIYEQLSQGRRQLRQRHQQQINLMSDPDQIGSDRIEAEKC